MHQRDTQKCIVTNLTFYFYSVMEKNLPLIILQIQRYSSRFRQTIARRIVQNHLEQYNNKSQTSLQEPII
jgi:hypothetical protein